MDVPNIMIGSVGRMSVKSNRGGITGVKENGVNTIVDGVGGGRHVGVAGCIEDDRVPGDRSVAAIPIAGRRPSVVTGAVGPSASYASGRDSGVSAV